MGCLDWQREIRVMAPDPEQFPDVCTLVRAATQVLDALSTIEGGLLRPNARERHRRQLEQAIASAERSLVLAGAQGGQGLDARTMARARFALVKAHAVRAHDARHGAGQLSLGSQRAPTRAACDDGWQRVAEIVAVAEASAAAAMRMAAEVDRKSGWNAAKAAEAAARDARRILDARNHAYTFHADPGFSFGEGWYLAAAAVLAGVAIQIEPDKPQSQQAERFLRDAGLGAQLVPYRSRPRANKHLPELIARAFHAEASSAQRRLRCAFLGTSPIPGALVAWADHRLAAVSGQNKVLLWVRHGSHHPTRNTTYLELVELSRRARSHGLVPILIGDALRDGEVPPGTLDMGLFWKEPLFQGLDMRRAQLQLFEHLREAHGLLGQLGVTTAGMDGPALMGLPTMYLTDAPNVRLGTWVGAVPGYQEIVRGDGYLERIGEGLQRWAVEPTRVAARC
jgi:hypothetical protein